MHAVGCADGAHAIGAQPQVEPASIPPHRHASSGVECRMVVPVALINAYVGTVGISPLVALVAHVGPGLAENHPDENNVFIAPLFALSEYRSIPSRDSSRPQYLRSLVSSGVNF